MSFLRFPGWFIGDTIAKLKGWWSSCSTASKLASSVASIGAFAYLLRVIRLVYRRRVCKMPPGPIGLPIFGSVLTVFAGRNYLYETAPSFGPIFYCEWGALPIYTINDHKLIHAIFGNKLSQNRPSFFCDNYKDSGNYKRIEASFADVNNDNLWHLRRKYMLKSIIAIANREFVRKQINTLLTSFMYDTLDKLAIDGSKWHPKEDLRHASFNIVFGAIFGENAQLEKNEEFYKISELVHDFIATDGLGMLRYFFPLFGFGRYLFRRQTYQHMGKFVECYDLTKKYTDEATEQYYEKLKKGSLETEATYFDEVLKQIISGETDSKHSVTREMLVIDLFTLLVASMDTTGTVMEYALLLAAKNPIIQEEIYKEISMFVVKNDKDAANSQHKLQFELTNVLKCPKFRAFISEALRISCVGLVGGGRALSQDCQISFDIDKKSNECCNIKLIALKNDMIDESECNGAEYKYILKEDTMIEANFGYIMRGNENLWNKKENANLRDLNLSNWLKRDESGNIRFEKNNVSMPFSFGVRDCVGQSLAMKELYGFLGNLMLNYTFSLQDISTEIKVSGTFVTEIEPQIPLIVKKRE